MDVKHHVYLLYAAADDDDDDNDDDDDDDDEVGLMSLGVGLTVLLLGTKLPKREAVSWRQETGFCLFTS